MEKQFSQHTNICQEWTLHWNSSESPLLEWPNVNSSCGRVQSDRKPRLGGCPGFPTSLYRGRGGRGGARVTMSAPATASLILLLLGALVLSTESRPGIHQPMVQGRMGLYHGRRVGLYNPSIVKMMNKKLATYRTLKKLYDPEVVQKLTD